MQLGEALTSLRWQENIQVMMEMATNVIHTQKKNKKTLTLVISNENFTP
jgi:hypothetical protein